MAEWSPPEEPAYSLQTTLEGVPTLHALIDNQARLVASLQAHAGEENPYEGSSAQVKLARQEAARKALAPAIDKYATLLILAREGQ